MNGIELKTVNPVVFDDPEYCNKGEILGDACAFLKTYDYTCRLFDNTDLKYDTPENSWHAHETICRKCQQCKDHYQRNKP